MTSRSPGHRRRTIISGKAPVSSFCHNKLPNASQSKKHHSGPIPPFALASPLTSPRLSFSGMQNGECSVQRQPSKLLVNVSMENSPGAMQVVMLAEETVADLVKAALVFYVREKRRPFLKDTDPNHYDLHYSSFALRSLEAEEKLMKLGSRNFYLCSKPVPARTLSSRCHEKDSMMTVDSARPWMIFVHLLL